MVPNRAHHLAQVSAESPLPLPKACMFEAPNSAGLATQHDDKVTGKQQSVLRQNEDWPMNDPVAEGSYDTLLAVYIC